MAEMLPKKKRNKKRPQAKKPAETPRTSEARPAARSGKRLSAFYATGPAVPLAAPGPKKGVPTAAPGGLQKKETKEPQEKPVAVGRRGDAFEREADAVAERTVTGQSPRPISRIPAGGLAGGGAQHKEEEKKDEGPAQKKDEEAQQKDEDRTQEKEDEEAQQSKAGGEEEGAAQSKADEEKESTQTKEEEPAQKKEKDEAQTKEEEPAQKKEEDAAQQEEEEATQKLDDGTQEEEEAQEKSAAPSRRDKGAVAARAIRSRGTGEPLSPSTRSSLEAGLGHDLSAVRVHAGGSARQAAKEMGARAFTHKNHIWLGPGESPSNLKLMAHEATHTVQQGAATRPRAAGPRAASTRHPAPPALGAVPAAQSSEETVQRKEAARGAPGGKGPSAGTPKPAGEMAPGIVELKGQSELVVPDAVAGWLEERKGKKGTVEARFGSLARGPIEVGLSGGRPRVAKKQAIRLRHELFEPLAGLAPDLAPSLVLEKGVAVHGWIGVAAGTKLPSAGDLTKRFKTMPGLAGLPGFDLGKLPTITNKLEDGALKVGVSGAKISFGALFDGTLSFSADDERVTSFNGTVQVEAQGLATGKLDLARDPKGTVTGKAAVGLNLPKNFSGNLTVAWDGKAASGEGKVGYQGEKLSGSVTLRLMERQAAAGLEAQKKAPPEGAAAGGQPAPKKGKKPAKEEYVLFGEGDLTFAFTDWLSGTAHVIVDPKGFVTIIGKITPQKELELFPQKDYNKELFKVEARAAYGIPVVGNIFIFANVSMGAFAKIGPAKLYKIEVNGTYSTDPEKAQSFSIQGSLNLSAAAGLRLRGEGGAGLEILEHDIKAGAGVNGLAGIRGYAEATPVIGYREKPAEQGVDKKGEFFIKGDVEIAAQPFLGLSGDLFVELDSPWWSPAPDKKWTWPLGSKEWPVGGSFGIGASVDYVFGSDKIPEVKFQEVDFSADKFLTDLYSDKTQAASKPAERPGTWKEKNTKAAEPPSKETTVGDGQPGKAPALPKAKSKVKPGGPKKTARPADPNARTASGKTVGKLKKEAAKKEALRATGGPAAPGGKAESRPKAGAQAESPEVRWMRGVAAVEQALAYAKTNGIDETDLNRILKSVRRQKQFGFKLLSATSDPKDPSRWLVHGSMSPDRPVTTIKKRGKESLTQKTLDDLAGRKDPTYPTDTLSRATGPSGHVKGIKKGEGREELPAVRELPGGVPAYQPGDHRGHLIGDRFMGSPIAGNLVPMHPTLNLSTFKRFENAAAQGHNALKAQKKPVLLHMEIVPHYPKSDKLNPASYRPKSITATGKIITIEKPRDKVETKETAVAGGGTLPNPDSAIVRHPPVNLNTAPLEDLETLPAIGKVLAARIVAERESGGLFRTYRSLMERVPGIGEERLQAITGDPYRPARLLTGSTEET